MKDKETVFLSISFVAILLASPMSLVAAAPSSHTITVPPSGSNDTANIQAAFNACVAFGPHCNVELEKGTYYTAQIAVNGFQGNFVGMGQGLTIVQALPNLSPPAPQYNTPTSPFWAGPPGPANPWPVLFTFVGGSFGISQMAFIEPYASPISTPGWFFPGGSEWYSLAGMIYFVGLQANVVMDHVTVQGAAGNSPFGYNINNGIFYEGFILPASYTDPLRDVLPISGTILVTDSKFDTLASGQDFENLANAQVTASSNNFNNVLFALYVADLSNTKADFSSNTATAVSAFSAFWADQGLYVSNLLPSKVSITNNDFQVGQGASAVSLYDYGANTLNAVVSGNVLRTDTSCGCYDQTNPVYSVVVSQSLKSLSVSGNTILGGGAAGVSITGGPGTVSGNAITGSHDGVWVGSANGVHVAGNTISSTVQWGIAVTDGSSNNLVTGNHITNSGVADIYWDGTGTGNAWHGNQCQTSGPAGLC